MFGKNELFFNKLRGIKIKQYNAASCWNESLSAFGGLVRLWQIKSLLIIFFLAIFLTTCNGGKMPEKTAQSTSIKDIPDTAWKKLSEKAIYFGHQSVGFNIIDGIKDVMRENPQINLNIVEINDPSKFNTPLFAHSKIGQNRDPRSKIENFANFMEKGIGEKTDIAFFKFCYVDVTAVTDIDKVFNDYKGTMAHLKGIFPAMRFIHSTVPITTKPTGIKGLRRKAKNLIKKIIGRPVFDYRDNINRNRFNEMVRKEYSEKEPIFDLAKIESTFPNGARSSFIEDGKIYYSLVSDYTHDGGHLNEKGRKIIAEQLLILLAGLCK
jgi:hypothetical protein